jgi:hypothetical protein
MTPGGDGRDGHLAGALAAAGRRRRGEQRDRRSLVRHP